MRQSITDYLGGFKKRSCAQGVIAGLLRSPVPFDQIRNKLVHTSELTERYLYFYASHVKQNSYWALLWNVTPKSFLLTIIRRNGHFDQHG